MLWVISDMSFNRDGGKKIKLAGKKNWGEWIRSQEQRAFPINFDASSESENEKYAAEINASFIDKIPKNISSGSSQSE